MTDLFLIDADSVGLPVGATTPPPWPPPVGAQAVVVVAMNFSTASQIKCVDQLQRGASDFVAAIGRYTEWRLEACLVPCVPEAADAALVRLALFRPQATGEVIHRVLVRSKDRSLSSGIATMIGGKHRKLKDIPHWSCVTPREGAYFRDADWSAPDPVALGLGGGPTLGSLSGYLEHRIDQAPAVCPTWYGSAQSLRAVDRLSAYLTPGPNSARGGLGAAGIRAPTVVPDKVQCAGPAPAGAGVQIASGGTLSTRLPPSWLRGLALTRPTSFYHNGDEGRVLDDNVMPVLAAHSPMRVEARMGRVGKQLFAEVGGRPDMLPEQWWVGSRLRRARIRVYSRHPLPSVRRPVACVAAARVVWRHRDFELVIAGAAPKGKVTTVRDIPAFGIGRVLDESGEPHALLTTKCVPAGTAVNAIPLVDAPRHHEYARLGHLPLLVSDP